MKNYNELRAGFETAYIDGSVASSLAYRPQFVSNNYKEGKKVLSSIEDELLKCDQFQISVAFITMSGITPLLQTLKELEEKNIPGEVLTTNYLNFSEPRALAKLNELTNITLKMYDVEAADEGFHTKGYIFRKDEIYRIIIGSSNITSAALTSNREWNTKLISTDQGEMAKEIVAEFRELWNSKYSLSFDEFYENYKEQYRIIKHQRDIAKQEEVTSLEKYKLQPNSMQVGFITNLKKIIDAGEERALLISATGTGKTYASAFAMRELGFKRVLFLVHRGQLARQTKRSYEKVFAKTVSMGLVGAGYHDYDADYVFATVQTLNRDEHLLQYAKDTFDCIVLDEAHRLYRRQNLSSPNSYMKFDEINRSVMGNSFTGTVNDETELDWIIKQSRFQVLFYDEKQRIRSCDINVDRFNHIVSPHIYKYIDLFSQMRCNGGNGYYDYVKKILDESNVDIRSYQNISNYDVHIFDHIEDMFSKLMKEKIQTDYAELYAVQVGAQQRILLLRVMFIIGRREAQRRIFQIQY